MLQQKATTDFDQLFKLFWTKPAIEKAINRTQIYTFGSLVTAFLGARATLPAVMKSIRTPARSLH